MITIPKNLKTTKYASTIAEVYKAAKPILDINLDKSFTKHDIGHSERILDKVNHIIDNTTVKLNDNERFVLVCAIFLHDIGMQTDVYLTDEEKKYDIEKKLKTIRDNHHIYTEKYIQDNVSNLGLHNYSDFVDSIILVAKHHRRLQDSIDLVKDKSIQGENIRHKLLCCLICLGDCLDIGNKRVDIQKLTAITINPESKFHWYCNRFISGVSIDKQKITVSFNFPEKYRNTKYPIYIKEHIEQDIQKHIDYVFDALDTYEIRLFPKPKIDKGIIDNEYSANITDELPKDLLQYIDNMDKPQKGLGEIEAYWGKRNAANVSIEELLTKTKSNEIFIAALGFSTVKTLMNDNVIDHFAYLINNSSLKITIVYPKSVEQLQKFRPEFKKEDLTKKYDSGQETIRTFKKRILEKYPNVEFEKYVEFRQYKDEIIPRHFLLQDNQSIFFGSYLVSELGGNSYLIKLNKNDDKADDNTILNGLYEIFSNEIVSIIQNSTIVNLK